MWLNYTILNSFFSFCTEISCQSRKKENILDFFDYIISMTIQCKRNNTRRYFIALTISRDSFPYSVTVNLAQLIFRCVYSHFGRYQVLREISDVSKFLWGYYYFHQNFTRKKGFFPFFPYLIIYSFTMFGLLLQVQI